MEKLMDMRTNKDGEFSVSSEVKLGKLFDEIYINVSKRVEDDGTYQMVEQYTKKIPTKVSSPLRRKLLMHAFINFEERNPYGLQFLQPVV